MDAEKELKDCLENRSPILFVGAGFTYKSKNKNGDSVELGQGLCNLLYNKFFESSTDSDILKRKKLALSKKTDGKLEELCQLLRNANKKDERNEYMTNYFSGCCIDDKDSRNFICNYKWEKIFTVNIDDLIENIYISHNKSLNVWNRNSDDKRHYKDKPTLIKLHGCVNNSKDGYVFDSDEYANFRADEDYMISEFGDSYSKNDIIFVGTEFNESDLKHIIEKYKQKGYSSVNKYFFIAPSIKDDMLMDSIENEQNMFYISMTAEKFCDFLKGINTTNEKKNRLVEYGLVNLYDRFISIPDVYSSGLYRGEDITYGDLRDNWDISNSNSELISWANKDNKNKIIALYGNDYVGKTCSAKRLLYDFFCNHYECYEFTLNSSYKVDLFLDYISDLDKNKNYAVLFETAAFQYESLVDRFITKGKNISCKIVIITTDLYCNHGKKYHSLVKNNHCKSIAVSEYVDKKRAELIYNKLYEKESVSRLYDLGNKEKIIEYMIKSNDIIDILYMSSLGRSFEDHIEGIMSKLEITDVYKKYLELLCFFVNIGIIDIPFLLFFKSASIVDCGFSKEKFELKFADLMQVNKGYYHLRYTKFFKKCFNKFESITYEEYKYIFKALVKYLAGRFNEGDYNEFSSFLYKLLSFKSLKVYFSPYELKKLYALVKDMCKQYSYYWVQCGLCAQKQESPDFEEADRFLRKAREIRPNSYQVTHAIAKNQIERGLEILKVSKDKDTFFVDGINEMKWLINNPRYSRALGYSLHSFIDSLLKYSVLTNNVIRKEDCALINESVEKLDDSQINQILCDIMQKLKSYSKNKKLDNYLGNVVSRLWRPTSDKNNLPLEDIENDWSA